MAQNKALEMKESAVVYIITIVAIVAVVLIVTKVNAPVIAGQITSSFCTDTDGGINLPVNGRARTTLQAWAFDSCRDKENLIEYYCLQEEIESQTINCVAAGYRTCEQGSCIH